MKELIFNLFGTYEPYIYNLQHDIVSSSGALEYTENISVVHPDIPFILGVGLFALTLFCIFKIIGGFLKR